MANVLVTGGTGFVGGHLVERLCALSHSVRCVVRSASQTEILERSGADVYRGDLESPETWRRALAGVDCVFHLAGQTRALRPAELERSNVQLTARVAEMAAAQAQPPVLIIVSSLAAGGPRCTEAASACGRPVSEYGRSKRRAEQLACQWADRVPMTIVRPGIVCGPRNEELLPWFRCVARVGCHAIPGFQPRRLSFIDVRDLSDLLLLIAEQGKRVAPRGRSIEGACYDACIEEQPTHQQLGTLLGEILNRSRVAMLHVPEPLVYCLGYCQDVAARWRGRPFPLNLDKAREATAGSWIGDWQRLRDELHFRPQRSLQEGLRDTAEWFRGAGWL